MKRILAALVLASFAWALAAADDAPNRKTWAASPGAYFLTSEERTAWRSVGTELKMKSDTKQEPVDPKDLEEKFEAVAASRGRPL